MENAFQNYNHSVHGTLFQANLMKYWKVFHHYYSVHVKSMFTIGTHGYLVKDAFITYTYHWTIDKMI